MKPKRLHTPEQWKAKLRAARNLKRAKKNLAIQHKGGKCVKCGGEYHPSVYDFHHLDPETKEARSAIFLNWGWDRIKPEIDKCDLLCANCHRVVHYQHEEENMENENMTPETEVMTVAELEKLLATKPDGELVFVTEDSEEPAEAETPTLH